MLLCFRLDLLAFFNDWPLLTLLASILSSFPLSLFHAMLLRSLVSTRRMSTWPNVTLSDERWKGYLWRNWSVLSSFSSLLTKPNYTHRFRFRYSSFRLVFDSQRWSRSLYHCSYREGCRQDWWRIGQDHCCRYPCREFNRNKDTEPQHWWLVWSRDTGIWMEVNIRLLCSLFQAYVEASRNV